MINTYIIFHSLFNCVAYTCYAVCCYNVSADNRFSKLVQRTEEFQTNILKVLESTKQKGDHKLDGDAVKLAGSLCVLNKICV